MIYWNFVALIKFQLVHIKIYSLESLRWWWWWFIERSINVFSNVFSTLENRFSVSRQHEIYWTLKFESIFFPRKKKLLSWQIIPSIPFFTQHSALLHAPINLLNDIFPLSILWVSWVSCCCWIMFLSIFI